MRYEYTDDGGVGEAVRSMGENPSVGGVMLLATDGGGVAVSEAIHNASVPVFGGVFPAVVYRGRRKESGAVVVGVESAVSTTTVTGVSESAAVRDQLDPAPVERGEQTAVVFVDSRAEGIGRLVGAMFDTYGTELTVIGGGTGRLSPTDQPTVFTETGKHTDAAVVATIAAPSTVGVQHGWEPVAGPYRVTDADETTVRTLEGRPAFEVYREAVVEAGGPEPARETFFENAQAYPFGISRLGGEPIVRDPFEVTAEGAIDCFGPVPEGEFLHLLHADTERLAAAAADAYQTAAARDTEADLITFDCMSRSLYLDEAFTAELDAMGDSNTPAVGALTLGELANDGHGHLEYYNKTNVIGTLEDG